ncbi:MAG: hypothetical protein H6978_06865 [Gammaproteobacteria bacterium]|nr:hypothetical protein [Gammaproteobacteria bacterium]
MYRFAHCRSSRVATPLAFLLYLISCAATIAADVSGPVTGGDRGKPFAAPDYDLARYGYVAEEFFLDGQADAFELVPGTTQGVDGRWQLQRKAERQPFRTRLLIVRPADDAAFNGTVVVHWQNVTAGYELGSVPEGELLRGFAWVGVSAQKVGIDGFPGPQAAGLRQWDPQRYGSLAHPGDDYSFDIFTQAARAVAPRRPRQPVDPMGGLSVARLIASGGSQSAARLRAYINGVHPQERIFDGFIPYIDLGRARAWSNEPAGNGPTDWANARIRDDIETPVFIVNSETETESYLGARQPDTDRFHFWEVAGTSHVSVPREALLAIDTPLRPGVEMRGLDAPNYLSYRPAYEAAIRHMHRWLISGDRPPSAPRIELNQDASPQIRRDENGNAYGGIRLPDFAVPLAEHRGWGSTLDNGYRLGFLYGHARLFSTDKIRALYPTTNAYLADWDESMRSAVEAGYVLAEDAPVMRETARQWYESLTSR